MATLSKEQYDHRRENAYLRYAQNKEIVQDSMTDEQIEIIEEVCTKRHEIHTSHIALYNTEAGNHAELWRWIDEIDDRISEAEFDIIGLEYDGADIPLDTDIELEDSDDWSQEEINAFHEKKIAELGKLKEEINTKIEVWLSKIDEKHGTHYAPTGAQRIF